MYIQPCTDMADQTKRPTSVIIPPPPVKRGGCPVCGSGEYGGKLAGGVLTRTCRSCGNVWQGGTGVEPQDPRIPFPPEDPSTRPNIEFARTRESGDRPVDFLVRKPDLTQDFRKGAPIPLPGEEENG